MSTQSSTIDFILSKLGDYDRFTTRKMFGEYALYVDGKVVALVCDDQLYIKIVPASSALAQMCEQDTPYPGAKPYYLVEEHQLSTITNLSEILVEIAKTLPEKKKKK
jgi:TfoX/Sxy family transcriptional regulator of competence genes